MENDSASSISNMVRQRQDGAKFEGHMGMLQSSNERKMDATLLSPSDVIGRPQTSSWTPVPSRQPGAQAKCIISPVQVLADNRTHDFVIPPLNLTLNRVEHELRDDARSDLSGLTRDFKSTPHA